MFLLFQSVDKKFLNSDNSIQNNVICIKQTKTCYRVYGCQKYVCPSMLLCQYVLIKNNISTIYKCFVEDMLFP